MCGFILKTRIAMNGAHLFAEKSVAFRTCIARHLFRWIFESNKKQKAKINCEQRYLFKEILMRVIHTIDTDCRGDIWELRQKLFCYTKSVAWTVYFNTNNNNNNNKNDITFKATAVQCWNFKIRDNDMSHTQCLFIRLVALLIQQTHMNCNYSCMEGTATNFMLNVTLRFSLETKQHNTLISHITQKRICIPLHFHRIKTIYKRRTSTKSVEKSLNSNSTFQWIKSLEKKR